MDLTQVVLSSEMNEVSLWQVSYEMTISVRVCLPQDTLD